MKKLGLLFLGVFVFLAMSCESTKVAENKTEDVTVKVEAEVREEPKVKESPAVVHPLKIEDARYDELMQKSLVSVGNTYRLKKVIEKLRAGDEVYIAALGGSVTEGAGPADYKDGYAYQFCRKLKKTYCPDGGKNVYFNGAGLSGTPSELGLVRYESDVVQVLGHNPDLLIVEFAVNDDGQDASTRAFEALVRNALVANDECAVIGLYSAATYGNSAAAKTPVGNYYRIPQVNVLALVNEAVSVGDFTKEKYYTDTVHPTKDGHEIQADCLMNLVAKTDAASMPEPFDIPEEWYKTKDKAFTNFTRILGNDENVTIDAGSFTATDNSTQSIKKTGKGNFPQNWHHSATTGTESFVMNISCKSLIFVYKEQGSWLAEKFGNAEVYVDGKKVATFDGGKAGGWCNCVPKVIIDGKQVADHVVEVKMTDADASKGFTIVAMGY
ncbi:MAG: SGNH/GDSL hydrolase family protein, partial [Treponema sp.]|nr:SGNH/GDSL hydrolase family protein [Treponema sp.]